MPQTAANVDTYYNRGCDTRMFEKLDSDEDFDLVSGSGENQMRASSATQKFDTLENALTSGSRKFRRKERAGTAKQGGSQAIHDRKDR